MSHSVKRESELEMKVTSVTGFVEVLWKGEKWFSARAPTTAMTRPLLAGAVAVEMNADPRDNRKLLCVIEWSVKEADGSVRHLSTFTLDDQRRGTTLHLEVEP